jgi:hypothetical protein
MITVSSLTAIPSFEGMFKIISLFIFEIKFLAWYNINTMASGLTPIFSIPYPLATDGVDVHGDMEDLASRVEEILAIKSNLNTSNTFTGTNNFLTDTSSATVRITQNGSGPALLVEDSASVDSSPFVINSSGFVGIQTPTPTAALTVASGNVLFNTPTTITAATTVGINNGSNTVLSVFGDIVSNRNITSQAMFFTSQMSYQDVATSNNINILPPEVGPTANRNLRLPDVSGIIVTTGNRNDAYPSQATNAGRVLATDGTNVSWVASPNQVPSVTSQAGKWLSNDGSTYYWENLLLIPELDDTLGTGTAGKFLTNNGDEVSWDFLPGQQAFIEVTDDIVLEVGANLFCDTRGGNFSITLPENPLPGATVSVFDTQNFFQSEYVIIIPGTEKINAIEGDLILDVGGATVVFIYINETIGWRLA